MQRLAPLAQRLAVDFTTDPKFDNARAVQIRLPGFTHDSLCELGGRVRDLYAVGASPRIPALVDDLGGWLTATLDHRCWDDAPINPEVDDLVAAISGFHAPLALVSPEVGLTVVPMTAAGRRFTDELGALNQRLAACCERVVLIVAGQPVWIKPTPTATAP